MTRVTYRQGEVNPSSSHNLFSCILVLETLLSRLCSKTGYEGIKKELWRKRNSAKAGKGGKGFHALYPHPSPLHTWTGGYLHYCFSLLWLSESEDNLLCLQNLTTNLFSTFIHGRACQCEVKEPRNMQIWSVCVGYTEREIIQYTYPWTHCSKDR